MVSFLTYKLRAAERGYELVRVNGDLVSVISDPDYWSEREVMETIHDHVEHFERVPGRGWCVVLQWKRAP